MRKKHNYIELIDLKPLLSSYYQVIPLLSSYISAKHLVIFYLAEQQVEVSRNGGSCQTKLLFFIQSCQDVYNALLKVCYQLNLQLSRIKIDRIHLPNKLLQSKNV